MPADDFSSDTSTTGLIAGGTYTLSVSILNIAPMLTSLGAASAAENVSTATAVYTATATDPDAGAILTYSISGGADAVLFAIDASTGAVTFKTTPDFEAPADAGLDNSYDIEVEVSDGSMSDTRAIAITVTNLDETPVTFPEVTVLSGSAGVDNGDLTPSGATTAVKQTLQAGQFVGSILVNIMGGAQDTAAGKDITTLMGKVAVSSDYVQEQEAHHTVWAGASDIAAATSLLHGVTADPSSVLVGVRNAEVLIAAHA